jgi:hypothetical protein
MKDKIHEKTIRALRKREVIKSVFNDRARTNLMRKY